MASIFLQQVNKLRAKPEPHRRAWALGLSALFTGLIATVWAVNLSLTISANQVATTEPKLSPFGQVAMVATSNLDAVKDGFVTVFGDLFNLIGD